MHAFSFSLYGPEKPLYYTGLLENIQLVHTYFAGWCVFVYIGADVPESFVQRLESDPIVRIRRTGITGHKNSIYRFFAVDEPDVEFVCFRDADSRIHWKDRWAIRDFLQSGMDAHIIRDHVEHTALILAGMWGLRKGFLPRPLREIYESWTPKFVSSGNPNDPTGFGIDQNFLSLEIYPLVKARAHVTYSCGRIANGECGTEFPFEWANDVYCGRVQPIIQGGQRHALDVQPIVRKPFILNLPKVGVRLSGPK